MDSKKKVIQKVINKAWENDSFRSRLVDDAHKTIAEETGLKIPANVQIVFTDQTDPSKTFINLKPKPDLDDMELSEEELEQVAGGSTIMPESAYCNSGGW